MSLIAVLFTGCKGDEIDDLNSRLAASEARANDQEVTNLQSLEDLGSEISALKAELASTKAELETFPLVEFLPDSGKKLYVRCENIVNFSASARNGDSLVTSLTGDSGVSIREASQGVFLVNPQNTKSIETIERHVTLNDNSQLDLTDSTFESVTHPDALAGFAGVTSSGSLSKASITAAQGVSVSHSVDFLSICPTARATILSFKMYIERSGSLLSLSATGNRVTSSMKVALKQLKPGNRLFIYDVKVRLMDTTVRDGNAISIVVL